MSEADRAKKALDIITILANTDPTGWLSKPEIHAGLADFRTAGSSAETAAPHRSELVKHLANSAHRDQFSMAQFRSKCGNCGDPLTEANQVFCGMCREMGCGDAVGGVQVPSKGSDNG